MHVRRRPGHTCGSDMEIQKYESVAQLVELPAFNRKAAGSSPATFTIYGGVAQLVELPALNRKAAGSSPVTPTTYGNIAQSAERSAVNRQVVGSIPSIPARKLQRRRWLHRHLIALGAGSNPAGLSPRDCGATGRRGEKTTSVVIRSFSQKQDKNVTWRLTQIR